jgi:hypothetical protein
MFSVCHPASSCNAKSGVPLCTCQLAHVWRRSCHRKSSIPACFSALYQALVLTCLIGFPRHHNRPVPYAFPFAGHADIERRNSQLTRNARGRHYAASPSRSVPPFNSTAVVTMLRTSERNAIEAFVMTASGKGAAES